MKKFYILFLFVALGSLVGLNAAEVTDVLDQSKTGISGTSYKDITPFSVTSSAVYAGQCAGDAGTIQLRSKNSNSGIITTTSGGNVKKVVVVWNAKSKVDRTIYIYGSNTAYSTAADLYGTPIGTLLGSIVCGTSTELVITGDYQFIGIRSKSDALYLDNISITWETGVEQTKMFAPSLSLAEGTYYEAQTVNVAGDGDLHLSVNGTEQATTEFTMSEVGRYEVEAWATDPDGVLAESDHIVKTYVIAAPVTVVSIADFIEKGSASANADQVYVLDFDMTITYKYNKNLYVKDANNDCLYLFNTSADASYAQGAIISAGTKATYTLYNGLYEATNVVLAPLAEESVVVTPEVYTVDQVTLDAQSRYIKLEKVTLNSTDRLFVQGEKSVGYYNSFKVTLPTDETAEYDVICVTTVYQTNTAQVYPIAFTLHTSGIEDVEISDNASVEYFNLQGVRVSGELTPGLYIQRQGNKATKVLVK